MAIHHISCGSLCPLNARLVNGDGGWLEKGRIVCHCLLIESSDGLVLVDTGFGTADVLDPSRLGRAVSLVIRPDPREGDTAIERVRAAGHDPADVRHIVVTHLDLDHAGGLGDFPEAEVHVTVTEHEVAMDPPRPERLRYVEAQWAHGPRWRTHTGGGDDWFGFESVRVMPGVEPEIALIPLAGHSRGHAGVAIRDGGRWLLHCGDAYFHRGEIQIPDTCPPSSAPTSAWPRATTASASETGSAFGNSPATTATRSSSSAPTIRRSCSSSRRCPSGRDPP